MPDLACPLCGVRVARRRGALPDHDRGAGARCPASGGTRRRARVFAAHVRACPTGDRASCRLCAELGCADGFATCPACGLLDVPVLPDGSLANHRWVAGSYADGPDDADGNPTPGEWVGGCANREPEPLPGGAAEAARGEGPE